MYTHSLVSQSGRCPGLLPPTAKFPRPTRRPFCFCSSGLPLLKLATVDTATPGTTQLGHFVLCSVKVHVAITLSALVETHESLICLVYVFAVTPALPVR